LTAAAFNAFFVVSGNAISPFFFTGTVWLRITFFTVWSFIFCDNINASNTCFVIYFSLTQGVLPYNIWLTACSATAYFFPDFVVLIFGGVNVPLFPVMNAIGTNGKK